MNEKHSPFHMFKPKKFWISKNLDEKSCHIVNIIRSTFVGFVISNNFGEDGTLHIGTKEDVEEHLGTNIYYVSWEYFHDLLRVKRNEFSFSNHLYQRISSIFKSYRFALIGYEKEVYIVLVRKILALGGIVLKHDNNDNANIIISPNLILPLSINFYNKGIPVLTEEFIEDCYNTNLIPDFNKYVVPRFRTLVFSSTDIHPSIQKKLKTIIVGCGGIWKDSLDDSVNCLISERITLTPKTRIALTEAIPIIHQEWVFQHYASPISFEKYILNTYQVHPNITPLVFSGLDFSVHLEIENRGLIIEAIKCHGGNTQADSSINIVPSLYIEESSNNITQFWVWECISKKKILPYDHSVIFKPLRLHKHNMYLSGTHIVVDCINKDSRSEIIDILRTLGAIVTMIYANRAKFLIMDHEDEKIIEKAQKNSTKIVPVSWVTDLLSSYLEMETKPKKSLSIDEIEHLCNKIKSPISRKASMKVSFKEEIDEENCELSDPVIKYTQKTPSGSASQKKDDTLLEAIGLM